MNNKRHDLVILVNEDDNETGTIEKLEAHKKALLHRAISVFIFNSRGEWLLQRRASGKYHSKDLWTNACCSHPYPGETTLDAANRRLSEEMGLKAPLEKLFHFTYKAELDNELTEHEFDHVYGGITDEKPDINTEEVKEWRYMAYDDLLQDVKERPELYTFWFKEIFEQVHRHVEENIQKEKFRS